MPQQYTIGQRARAVGVPVTTLRYDERAGLVRPTPWAEHAYRRYARQTLQVVRVILAAQAAGCPREDVRTLLTLNAGDMPLCREVQALRATRVAEVSKRLRTLRHRQGVRQSFLATCHAQDHETLCHVVHTLSGASSAGVDFFP
jgi:DNA-binding transcriptional MerR regulator